MMRPLVMCGSKKNKEHFDIFVSFLRKRGVLVNSPNFQHQRKKRSFLPDTSIVSPTQRLKVSGLVHTHIQKIREVANMGGICLIMNPVPRCGQKLPFGYIGDNTILEIGEAHASNMIIIMLRPYDDVSIMSVVPADHKDRFFVFAHPKADPSDPDAVWSLWLRRWLNG